MTVLSRNTYSMSRYSYDGDLTGLMELENTSMENRVDI